MVECVPPVHSTLAEITGFLERYPPFSTLRDEALAAFAATVEIEYFPAGAEILAQDGSASEHLYVVRSGSVALVDDSTVVDVLEEGESFGHPSLLSGMPPTFTVRAHEDALCLLFAIEPALAVLTDPAGVRFVVASLTDRLEKSAASRPKAPWGTGRIASRTRPPLVCTPAVTIREAARRMTDAGEQSVVVPLAGGGHAIVTDHDLRARVVTGEISVDAPVSALAAVATPVVPADRKLFEVLVDMVAAGVDTVLVEKDGIVVGVADHDAVLDPGVSSPLFVRREVERAADVSAVAAAVGELPRIAVRLLDASAAPQDVLATLSSMADAVTRRLTELAVASLGEPPTPWAWLALGSEARREQTLATDQDNALAHEEGDGEVDRYFETLAKHVNRWLAECGYAECRAGVMARNPGWRLSRRGWTELLETWLRPPSRRDVHMAMIGLDLREVTGPMRIEADLQAMLATAPSHPYFLERLGQAALESRPPLGFLRELVVERSGDHVGTLDLKRVGTSPIVSFARRAAFSVGSTATSTVDRLRAAGARGSVASETALELEEAFVTLCRVRLEHQAAQIERGEPPDNHVDPLELAPLARRQLKEAFRAVARAQRSLETRAATRIP
jgi:CBS domain-containing protein